MSAWWLLLIVPGTIAGTIMVGWVALALYFSRHNPWG